MHSPNTAPATQITVQHEAEAPRIAAQTAAEAPLVPTPTIALPECKGYLSIFTMISYRAYTIHRHVFAFNDAHQLSERTFSECKGVLRSISFAPCSWRQRTGVR